MSPPGWRAYHRQGFCITPEPRLQKTTEDAEGTEGMGIVAEVALSGRALLQKTTEDAEGTEGMGVVAEASSAGEA
jgi:hypothetical protein